MNDESEEMIFVAMLPEQREAFERWLLTRGAKLGRLPEGHDCDGTPVFIIMALQMEWTDPSE